jgi:hypothetical protein
MSLTMVSRRATFALGAGLLAAPSIALADMRTARENANGEEVCGQDLGSNDTVRQLKPHWCWAACIQTIFSAHGYNVSQNQIVQKIFGDQKDQSATGPEILSAINGKWSGDHGHAFQASGFVLWDRVGGFERPDALPIAVKELQAGNPLIFANDRHTMVLTSMKYNEGPKGEINVDQLTVRDPWPESPSRHTLSCDEIARSGFFCGVHVTPATTV